MHAKLDRLKDLIGSYGSLAVAFSGGVDSAFLLKAASEVLGDKLLAITVSAPVFPAGEGTLASSFCRENNIRQRVEEFDVLQIAGFTSNPPNRCYICKRALFGKIREIGEEEGIAVIAEGTNADDATDYRPGIKALEEMGMASPLKEVGLTKQEIRDLSREMGLRTWNNPSHACLATRFPYGEEITAEKLQMIDDAEEYLRDAGVGQVRVRIHDRMARIEVMPGDFDKIMKNKDTIYASLEDMGFTYVSLDLKGYRTGSMNETLGSI